MPFPFPSLPSPPNLFPTYLVPSLPFRRRKSSADSNASLLTSASSSSTITSTTDQDAAYLNGHESHLRCARCLSDLALSSQIISKGFTGRHGRAYLVAPSEGSMTSSSITTTSYMTAKARNDALSDLPNTYTHKPVPRQLVTGAHTVGDISCSQCGSVLGWKYIHADDDAQKYKIGKFILETKRVCRSSNWETMRDADADEEESGPPTTLEVPQEEVMEFDSDDEDEREALFMGRWTPQVAGMIRREKASGYVRGVLFEEE